MSGAPGHPDAVAFCAELVRSHDFPRYAATLASSYMNLRKLSIFGGTNEIQKNIISKMIVGL